MGQHGGGFLNISFTCCTTHGSATDIFNTCSKLQSLPGMVLLAAAAAAATSCHPVGSYCRRYGLPVGLTACTNHVHHFDAKPFNSATTHCSRANILLHCHIQAIMCCAQQPAAAAIHRCCSRGPSCQATPGTLDTHTLYKTHLLRAATIQRASISIA